MTSRSRTASDSKVTWRPCGSPRRTAWKRRRPSARSAGPSSRGADRRRVDDLGSLARRFERFARAECGEAPLYRRLAGGIAGDPTLLALAAHGQAGPKPNLLLAAVHYLLLQGAEHPVRAFYPSAGEYAAPPGDPYPA